MKPKSITSPPVEGNAVETSMLGAESVKLQGVLPADTMRHEPEHNSFSVDGCNIFRSEKIG